MRGRGAARAVTAREHDQIARQMQLLHRARREHRTAGQRDAVALGTLGIDECVRSEVQCAQRRAARVTDGAHRRKVGRSADQPCPFRLRERAFHALGFAEGVGQAREARALVVRARNGDQPAPMPGLVPAAAMVIARLAISCPRTSAKSMS